MKTRPDPYFKNCKIKIQEIKSSVPGVCWKSKKRGTQGMKTEVLSMGSKKNNCKIRISSENGKPHPFHPAQFLLPRCFNSGRKSTQGAVPGFQPKTPVSKTWRAEVQAKRRWDDEQLTWPYFRKWKINVQKSKPNISMYFWDLNSQNSNGARDENSNAQHEKCSIMAFSVHSVSAPTSYQCPVGIANTQAFNISISNSKIRGNSPQSYNTHCANLS